MRTIRLRRRAGVLLCAALLLTGQGCSDYEEINQLALINLIGADQTEEGKYVAYYQVINPTGVTSQINSAIKAPVYTYAIEADSMTELGYKTATMLPRKLFVQHFQGYVVSERMARQGLREWLNFFEMDPTRRKAINVYITGDPLDKFMNTFVSLEKMPGRDLRNIQSLSEEQMGVVTEETRINDLMKNLETDKLTFVTSVQLEDAIAKPSTDTFELIKGNQGNFRITGTSLIKHGRMIGRLGLDESSVCLLANGMTKSMPVKIKMEGGTAAELRIYMKPKVKRELALKQGKPSLTVRIRPKLALVNNTQNADLTLGNIREIEERFNKQIETSAMALWSKGKAEGWDVYGIQSEINKRRGEEWSVSKRNKDAWREAEVRIAVDGVITRTGTAINPYKEKSGDQEGADHGKG